MNSTDMPTPHTSENEPTEALVQGCPPVRHEYRVTKYNPQNRDRDGRYLGTEWTSYSDIGKCFDGKVLTEQEYLKAEDAFMSAAVSFLNESGIDRL